MNKLDEKIEHVKESISILEQQCKNKLNCENVPIQYWHDMFQLLQKREKLVEALDHLIDLKNSSKF